MSEFDEYITGVMELTVGGKDLKLKTDIKDKRKLKSIFINGAKLDEKGLETMDNTFLGILYASYPNESKEGLLGFYEKFDLEFMTEFLSKVGWVDKDAVKSLKEENLKEVQKGN